MQGSLSITDDLIIGNHVAPTIATNDYLIIADASNNYKILPGPSLNTSNTTVWLNQSGAWSAPRPVDVGLGNVSNNAALNNETGAAGDIIYWSDTDTPAHLINTQSSATQYLGSNSTTGPAWVDLPVATTSILGIIQVGTGLNVTNGVVGVTYGTTASTSLEGNQVLFTLNNAGVTANTTVDIYASSTGGTAGSVLIGAGATAEPEWYDGLSLTGTDADTYTASFLGTTASGSTSTGAVTIAGGLGVGGSVSATRFTAYGTDAGHAYMWLYQNNTISGGISLRTLGTAGTEGEITLTLGNYYSSAEANNASGSIWLYHANGSASIISAGRDSGNSANSINIDSYLSVNDSIESLTGSIVAPSGSIWAGTAGDTTAERVVGARAAAGSIYMYSSNNASGTRGIYTTNSSGSAAYIVSVNTDNQITNLPYIACGLELTGSTPYIDFHHSSSAADHTSRLIANYDNGITLSSASGSDSFLYIGNSTNNAGVRFPRFGGGIYMSDSTWVQIYGSKHFSAGAGSVKCAKIIANGNNAAFIKQVAFSKSYSSLAAGAQLQIDLTTAQSGYTFLAYTRIMSGHVHAVIRSFSATSVWIKNVGSAAISGTVEVTAVFIYSTFL